MNSDSVEGLRAEITKIILTRGMPELPGNVMVTDMSIDTVEAVDKIMALCASKFIELLPAHLMTGGAIDDFVRGYNASLDDVEKAIREQCLN